MAQDSGKLIIGAYNQSFQRHILRASANVPCLLREATAVDRYRALLCAQSSFSGRILQASAMVPRYFCHLETAELAIRLVFPNAAAKIRVFLRHSFAGPSRRYSCVPRGAIAQLGERCNRTAEVASSILASSTNHLQWYCPRKFASSSDPTRRDPRKAPTLSHRKHCLNPEIRLAFSPGYNWGRSLSWTQQFRDKPAYKSLQISFNSPAGILVY